MRTTVSRYRLLGLALTAALLQSCGAPKSSTKSGAGDAPVPTNKMTINLTVEATDSVNAVVRVNLNDGKLLSTSYRLDGGDQLRACLNATCRPLADNNSVYTPDYIATFLYQPGIDYVVSFNRQKAADAMDSRVALPPPFTLVTPANGQQVTDGDTVLFTWTPSGAPVRVDLSYKGTCTTVAGGSPVALFGSVGADPNDDGSEPVSIDELMAFHKSTGPAMTRCSLDFSVRHELTGRIDAAFDGGFATGIVSRKVTLDYIPR